MKALVLEGLNEPLKIKEIANPAVSADEVLIQVKAAALNHRDVWIQKGQYAGIKYPSVLGSDGAGIVVETGPDADKNLIGKEVIINPGHNWGDNPDAQSKNFKILGLPDYGTFAQYVKVPACYVVAKPAHLSFEEAAALPLAGLTAYRALFSRGKLQNGEKVLISGAGGGVALFALQFALAAGAQVYVTSGSDAKIKKAQELGAVGGVNYKNANWAEDLKKQAGGFQVIIDSAAGEGFVKLTDLALPGGRIIFYGGTQGAIKNLAPQKIFWKQLSVLGSTMGTEEEFKSMVELVKSSQLKPVIDHVFSYQEAEKALRRMERGEQFGKIILQVG